jgi:PAS domain S-box-containing protein
VNDRFLKTCGYSRVELIGKRASELNMWVEREDQDRIAKMLDERGSVQAIEFSIRAKDGETLFVQISAEIIELEGKRCMLAAYEDITRRKRAEEEQSQLQAAVQKSALEWRLTFDAVDSPILLLDVSGSVVRLNRAARDLSGKSYWEIKGKPIKSIRAAQPWLKVSEMVAEVARSRGSLYSQVRDGELYKTWDISVRFFSASGTDDRIIVVTRDITPTVELQESLRRSETMSAMGALVAGVAHEVRNPLFSVSATIDAFEARFGEKEEHHRYISVLRRELDRLNQLMQDLLEYGRPAKLDIAKGQLNDAIFQAINSCTPLAERCNVRLENKVDRPLAPVMIDRGRIVQVFQNLIENAIQHSPPGSTVTVEAEEIRKNKAVWVNCLVRDMGAGFRDEDLPRIFEPFFTRRRGGTGLGLSIVQRIVEEHGGRIFASNQPGGGAAMGVTFQALQEGSAERQGSLEHV